MVEGAPTSSFRIILVSAKRRRDRLSFLAICEYLTTFRAT